MTADPADLRSRAEEWFKRCDGPERQISAALIRDLLAEVEALTRQRDGHLSCSGCGGPHQFDTSVPSVLWNQVIRAAGLPEYLCTMCIVRAFARAGVSFTAELYGDDFHGLPIEVRINGEEAQAAAKIQDENNLLRHNLHVATQAREAAEGRLENAPWKASYVDMRNQRDAAVAKLAEAERTIAAQTEQLEQSMGIPWSRRAEEGQRDGGV